MWSNTWGKDPEVLWSECAAGAGSLRVKTREGWRVDGGQLQAGAHNLLSWYDYWAARARTGEWHAGTI